MSAAAGTACALAALVSAWRWLRVAQVEHYLPGACVRFSLRWWRAGVSNIVLALAATAGLVGAVPGALAIAVVETTGPLGLSLRGRTSSLKWTRRARTTAAVWLASGAALGAVLVAAGIAGYRAAAVVAYTVPATMDLALLLTAPMERRLANRWVERARATLEQVKPTVVAVTGSFGKTTTKSYISHLISGTRSVVASPGSFNNRAGLARAVNEHLAPGTEVFVAEMGTYGAGEIAELCGWLQPTIAAITAVGPAHLERFRTEARTLAAKAEIVATAPVAVLNVDDTRLAALADAVAARGAIVWRCSANDTRADVAVVSVDAERSVKVRDHELGSLADEFPESINVAIAVAVALALDTPHGEVQRRLATLPSAEHRLSAAETRSGAAILDDTFNSNPAGAARALVALRRSSPDGRRVVVTPGMVELGPRQAVENEAFARAASEFATHIIVVGRTNRSALLAGAQQGSAEVITVETRPDAVAWVSANLGSGDAVLYENDLPDIYP